MVVILLASKGSVDEGVVDIFLALTLIVINTRRSHSSFVDEHSKRRTGTKRYAGSYPRF